MGPAAFRLNPAFFAVRTNCKGVNVFIAKKYSIFALSGLFDFISYLFAIIISYFESSFFGWIFASSLRILLIIKKYFFFYFCK